mgnify:CR=1 FL=1
MGEYQRSTRECSLGTMNPLLANAIRDHIDQYELEDIYESLLMCCETSSTKETKKLFRRQTETVILGLVLTPKWLIRAGSHNGELAGVLSGRLSNLRVEDYEKTTMHDLIPDRGINVSGFQAMTEEAIVFIGFGPEPVGQKFRNKLREEMTSVS